MTLYVDSDDFKKSNALQGTTFNTDDIDNAIAAASAGVNMACGDRDFGRTDDDEVRRFRPDDQEILSVDDIVEIVSLRVDRTGTGDWEDWTEDDDYRTEPLNAVVRERPITSLRVMTGKLWPTARLALVEITGTFGWPAPPPQVVEVTQIVAAQLVKRKEAAPFGFVFTGDAAAYLIRKDPQLEFMLNGLSRFSELHTVKLS